MYIICRWVGLNLGEIVGLEIQNVLPVMSAIGTSSGWAPLDEEQLGLILDIARSFVNLERQGLELLYCRIGSDDIKELWGVGNETGLVDLCVAANC